MSTIMKSFPITSNLLMDDGVLEERLVSAITEFCLYLLGSNAECYNENEYLDDPFEAEEECPEAFTDDEVMEEVR